MLLVMAIVRQADLGRIVLDLVGPGSAGLGAERGIVGDGSGATCPASRLRDCRHGEISPVTAVSGTTVVAPPQAGIVPT